MYKRLELHNHTTESDARITCRELLALMCEERVDAFALTDHNTISGHRKMKRLLEEETPAVSCIYGMEYTTYYGHILCLNLREYVPWDSINRHQPELLFRAVREKGALAGIAHPYSVGWPFARGCRFEMTMTDYSCCDFIEIFNNPEPLHEVNEKGLLLWEKLVLSGNRIAATSGMDLHGKCSFCGAYATYIQGEDGKDVSRELEQAVRSQSTWVSKGPLLLCSTEGGWLSFQIHQTGKSGYTPLGEEDYLITLRLGNQLLLKRPADRIPLSAFPKGTILIPKLYEKEVSLEKLVCVSPVLFL